jgi:hypothetical protein
MSWPPNLLPEVMVIPAGVNKCRGGAGEEEGDWQEVDATKGVQA